MAQEIINIGATPNDQQGDPLRIAFSKVNNNFTQLFAAVSSDATVYSTGGANTTLFTFAAETLASAEIRVYTCDAVSGESQSVTIDAATKCDSTSVKFTAHSTLFNDTALTQYEMDIVGNLVTLYAVPLTGNLLTHYVNSSVIIKPPVELGLAIALDGYADGVALTTENDVWITTES